MNVPRLSEDEMELRKEIALHVSEGNAILSSIRFSEKLPEGEAEKLKKAFAHFDEAEELSEEMEVGGAKLSSIDEYAKYKEMYAGLFGKCFEGIPFQVREEVVNVLDSYVADSSEKMELLLRVRTLAGRQDVSPKVRLYLKFKLYNDFYEYLFTRHKILLLTSPDFSKADKDDAVGAFLNRVKTLWAEEKWVPEFSSVWGGIYRNSAAHFAFKAQDDGILLERTGTRVPEAELDRMLNRLIMLSIAFDSLVYKQKKEVVFEKYGVKL
ncbi:MAG: hypothetical protein AB1657_00595 [Candidatus Micrarchaeota archaeon]